jgi:hypothetical protein
MGAEAIPLLQMRSVLGVRNNIRMTVAIYLRSAILNMNICSHIYDGKYVFYYQAAGSAPLFFLYSFRR